MKYNLERIRMNIGATCLWEMYNLATGQVDIIRGKILGAGELPMCASTEYVRVSNGEGRSFLTIPQQIKEILV